jgi:2',3'-cyclic-nucleotide 2'-phosphodiesterase
MKIAFIGDIVGRPGRRIIKEKLKSFKEEYQIDLVVANGENASHGFGLSTKNAAELFNAGIDIMTGGNHSWDKKKDILTLFETRPVLRPDNYPKEVPGSGVKIIIIQDTKVAIVNLMGLFAMPQVLNPFTHALELVEKLHSEGIFHIVIDFHAEVTSEKRVLMQLLKGKVSAICGTHTHVGTDDLEITEGTFYVTDIGLTGCRDNVIGMDSKIPIQKALTGLGGHFEVPNSCKSVLQIVVVELNENAQAIEAYKYKLFDNKEPQHLKAIIN